ncbi:DsbA family oxidoreductase [Gulosibacter faecalis]|uniref:DsbA family oxidoreductase n=1 Tax=Gulosibacter faecalis TaxID=272240 RepID=A0ABW5V3Q2_9MICO|nr:DsbA family oxidoreductase [Gulosibacter faecalis]
MTESTASFTDPIAIDIWTDVVCPWCYIGESRLNDALEAEGLSDRFKIELHAFELDPSAPENAGGETNIDHLAQRKGMPREQVEQMESQVQALAAELDRPYAVERPMANTRRLHRVRQAIIEAGGDGDAFFLDLQRRYFAGEVNPFDVDEIVAAAAKQGLDEARTREVVASDEFDREVTDEVRRARMLGAQGVPFFLFDHKYTAPGALPLDTFRQVVRSLAAERDAEDAK